MTASWTNTALGLRCVDAVTNLPILDGLSAAAWPVHDPRRSTRAVIGHNAILSWHGLPGLGGWERTDAAGGDPWAGGPAIPYVVDVQDSRHRYLPIRSALTLPRPRLGVGDAVPTLRLYPTPSAAVPDGYAAIRARLQAENGRPAAWALVDVVAGIGPGATSGSGLAGPDGQVVVLLPWPEPAPNLQPHLQTWTLALSVRFGGLVGDARNPSVPPTREQIEAQGVAALFANRGRTDSLSLPQLEAGRDAVLQGAENPSDLVFVRI